MNKVRDWFIKSVKNNRGMPRISEVNAKLASVENPPIGRTKVAQDRRGEEKSSPIAGAIASLKVAREVGGELDIPDYEESYNRLVTMRDAILKYDWQINAAERPPTGDDYNEVFAMLGLVAGSQGNAKPTGKIWWSADNLAEAKQWETDLLSKGAISVVLKPEDDRENVQVLITLDRSKANEILGYAVDEEEWLDESDDGQQPVKG